MKPQTSNGPALLPVGKTVRHDMRHVPVAKSVPSRVLGLIGRHDRDRMFLLIPRCRSVHTWFMLRRIDIAFLSVSGVVLDVRPNARPWSMYTGPGAAKSVLELPAGHAKEIDLARGDEVMW